MALKLRMTRRGSKNRPYYWIVAADGRAPRDGKFIEKVGSYDPLLPKGSDQRVKLVKERVEYWLSQGAKPSDRVAIFLGKAGITETPAQKQSVKKAQPKPKTVERRKEKEEKRKAAEEAAAAAAAQPEPEAAPAEESPAEAVETPAEEKPAEEAPAADAEAPAEEEKKEA